MSKAKILLFIAGLGFGAIGYRIHKAYYSYAPIAAEGECVLLKFSEKQIVKAFILYNHYDRSESTIVMPYNALNNTNSFSVVVKYSEMRDMSAKKVKCNE